MRFRDLKHCPVCGCSTLTHIGNTTPEDGAAIYVVADTRDGDTEVYADVHIVKCPHDHVFFIDLID